MGHKTHNYVTCTDRQITAAIENSKVHCNANDVTFAARKSPTHALLVLRKLRDQRNKDVVKGLKLLEQHNLGKVYSTKPGEKDNNSKMYMQTVNLVSIFHTPCHMMFNFV